MEQGQPLLPQRTLRKSLQDIEFLCGVLDEVFILVKVKLCAMIEYEQKCCLTSDKMKIQLIDWNRALDQLTGHINLPNHSGKADHALVLMLGGINTR